MFRIKLSLLAASASLLFATGAQAMPDDVAEMRQIIATEFGGDVKAYVEEESKDFRKMGCEGRLDLLQALLDDGLVLNDLSYRTHMGATSCAMRKEEPAAFKLLLTPDRMTEWEMAYFDENVMSPLQYAIYENEYGLVRTMLENGVHQAFNDDDYAVLTREEQLLLVANWANDAGKEHALRAFRDAGFEHILAAAQNKANVQFIRTRLGKGGGGGGGLFRTIAGGVAGAYLGGSTGAALGILEAGTSGADEKVEIDPTKPLPIPTNRAELGIMFQHVDVPRRGLEIQGIAEGKAASFTDLVKGDIIVAIGGMPVATRGSLYVATERLVDAEQFEVEYLRDGEIGTTIFGLPQPQPEIAEASALPVESQSVSAASGEDSTLAELERLADLRDRGVLTEEEFTEMKARILASD